MHYLVLSNALLTAALLYIAFLHMFTPDANASTTALNPIYIDSIVLFVSTSTDASDLKGDSITESFAAGSLSQRMAERYVRVLDVVNRGFSGYNSRQAIPVLKQFLATKQNPGQPVRLMTIWFGTNDAVVPGAKQHVPIEEYKANLATIVQLIRSPNSEYYSPETHLIMLTPGPMIDRGRPERKVERPAMYAKACMEVAAELGIPAVQVYDAIVEDAGGESEEKLDRYLYDGLHYTPKAYQVVFDKLIAVIDKAYPQLGTEELLANSKARYLRDGLPFWDSRESHLDVHGEGDVLARE